MLSQIENQFIKHNTKTTTMTLTTNDVELSLSLSIENNEETILDEGFVMDPTVTMNPFSDVSTY